MGRLWVFIIALGVLAAAMFILSLQYLFPPSSVQECKKIISEQPYEHEDAEGYADCITYVASIKRDKNICRINLNDEYNRNRCTSSVSKPEWWRIGYNSIMEGNQEYQSFDDLEAHKCNSDYSYNAHICTAMKFATQGS